MKFAKDNLNLEKGLDKEWIITNGIGGYSSSSIIGANTRKYHGLLIAPLVPPAKRTLILSKLDESIQLDENKYDLFSNIGKNYITHGYQYQQEFIKEYMPIFVYKVEDTEITKVICMEYLKNTVVVYYKVKNGKKNAKLTLAPIMNFRDIHHNNKNHMFHIEQKIQKKKIELKIDGGNTIYIKSNIGNYIEHHNDTFFNMFYIEEEKRGFEPEENHVVPGRFEIEIQPNEEKEISFICSLEENIEEIEAKKIITNEIIRIESDIIETYLINNRKENKTEEELKKDSLIRSFLISTDNFIVKRPLFNTYSIIAGYPWFLDWMRDTLISFEGLLLITRKFKIAKDVLRTCIRDIKYGLIPNAYAEEDSRPLYNSVDASLLFFEQVRKYIEYTDDYKFVLEEIYPKLKEIIAHYKNGIDLDDNNIYIDTDGLVVSGTENTQNTWMDAKYAGIPVTPRNGKAVEINALWYNALRITEELALKNKEKEESKKYGKMANKCKESFKLKFYNKKRKCLFDVIGDSKLRPNQLFALSLTYPVIEPDSQIAKEIIETVGKKLLNKYGLKTLAKGDENYVDTYDGDEYKRDFSYHQGITWTWIFGLYYNSLKNIVKNCKDKEEKTYYDIKLNEFIKNVTSTFEIELYQRGCVGSIAEIYDSKKPYLPKGAFAQAWSVAEVFRIILKK